MTNITTQTKRTIIVIEHDESVNLHEMLCKSIHEQDHMALTVLHENVVDINDYELVQEPDMNTSLDMLIKERDIMIEQFDDGDIDGQEDINHMTRFIEWCNGIPTNE